MSTDSVRTVADHATLTHAQRALLRKALDGDFRSGSLSLGQREAMHQLCEDFRGSALVPERLLIAFKASLIEAANDANLPYGPERSERLARLVTLFIGELYGLRVHDKTVDGTRSLYTQTTLEKSP